MYTFYILDIIIIIIIGKTVFFQVILDLRSRDFFLKIVY